MSRFSIEVGKVVKVEKKTFAQAYIEICLNGKPIEVSSAVSVFVDGCELWIGCQSALLTRNCLRLCTWGFASASTPDASSTLMALKPHLPKMCKLLAAALTKRNEPDGAVDLATGKPFVPPVPQIVYKFVDERVELVDEIKKSSRIFFMSMAAVPQDKNYKGSAGALTVVLLINGGGAESYYENQHFYFRRSGWLKGGVGAMRRAHDDATIKAAFQDLARNLLAQDTTPPEAETWSAVVSTKLELLELTD
jgi:hypothetical protein